MTEQKRKKKKKKMILDNIEEPKDIENHRSREENARIFTVLLFCGVNINGNNIIFYIYKCDVYLEYFIEYFSDLAEFLLRKKKWVSKKSMYVYTCFF